MRIPMRDADGYLRPAEWDPTKVKCISLVVSDSILRASARAMSVTSALKPVCWDTNPQLCT
jgi:hypothetical protein